MYAPWQRGQHYATGKKEANAIEEEEENATKENQKPSRLHFCGVKEKWKNLLRYDGLKTP